MRSKQASKIVHLYSVECYSARQIAKETGVSEKSVLQLLRDRGIEIRNGREYIRHRNTAKLDDLPRPAHIRAPMLTPEWWEQNNRAYAFAMRACYPGQRFKDDPRANRRGAW